MDHHQHHLGINKHGKSIRKSPLHQPTFQKLPVAAPSLNELQQSLPPPPPPHVYNISKSDFRSIVQQLTGSPARDPLGAGNHPAPARPPQPKPPSSRLMKNRPPPLTPIFRPPPPPFQNPVTNSNANPNLNPNTAFPRSGPSPTAPSCAAWADSPVSAYMRYLESSLLSLDGNKKQPTQGLLPVPGPFPLLRGHTHPSMPSHTQPGLLPSPGSQFSLLSPGWQFQLPSPSTQFPLPSPNSQLPLASPSSFLNLISPKSPSPFLSPRFQYPPSFTPNFSFSPMPQSGILGPGPVAQPPSSPNLLFPPSPSRFLPLLSPRWREM